jgi:hypothetical protein
MPLKFIPNPDLQSEVEDDDGVRAAVRKKAADIASRARDIAPVRTGRYRDSIHVEEDEDGVKVVADVEYGGVIEFGSSDTPVFQPLRRAAESAGNE